MNVQLALWVEIYPLSNIGFLCSNTPQIDKENVAAQTRINDWCCVSIPKSVRRSRRECVMWNLKSALSKIEKYSVFPIHVCEIRGSLFHSFRVTLGCHSFKRPMVSPKIFSLGFRSVRHIPFGIPNTKLTPLNQMR